MSIVSGNTVKVIQYLTCYVIGDHYMKCSLQSVTSVSHNTKLFTLELPAGSHMIVPIGYHVKIKAAAGVLLDKATKSINVRCYCFRQRGVNM